ncbi:aspartic proteinase CDR1-like [Papaver somniferum]|uniref:aspartic proteinase CDR1-like n=1 Tax=Papaver somniferum TaxID=3469 RepID=UPI000E7049B4|nr:aspartic proteinase CDR1-like [Papaver somniferum]
MATTTHFYLVLTLFLSVLISVLGSGFSVNLIHRDSPQSPFYNPLDALRERMQKAVHRSINRANHLKKLSSLTYSANYADGTISTSSRVIGLDYVMRISIGTPPRNVFVIAETGSDLTWVQCQPCEVCYTQISPVFNPKTSSTYKDVPCASGTCERLVEERKDTCENNLCQYSASYVDGDNSTGNLAFETLTWSWCLVSQLGSKIDSKFSYCLVPSYNVSSKFNFGSNAEMTGKDVLKTPLISEPSRKTFYYLKLEGISVSENMVPFRSSASSTTEDDYIIIDSGTTFTYLPQEMYSELESEVKKAINVEPIIGPKGLNLCYPLDASMRFPDVTVHFTGADIELGRENCFVPVGNNVVCLAFAPSDFGAYIYGSLSQINFLIEYALEEKKVSFKPTDCTKQG